MQYKLLLLINKYGYSKMLSIIETHEEFKQNLKESRETKTKRYKEKNNESLILEH